MVLWADDFEFIGEHVKLVPMNLSLLDDLWEVAKHEELWTFMLTKVHTKDELKQYMETAIMSRNRGEQYPFIVIDVQSGKVLGTTRFLDISEQNKCVEIGSTWYDPSVWKTYVNTECKLLLLSHAFEQWKLNRVFFKTDSRNTRSQDALARLGAMKEGILRRDKICSDGYVRNSVYFSILREEWPKVKQHLQDRLTRNVTY